MQLKIVQRRMDVRSLTQMISRWHWRRHAGLSYHPGFKHCVKKHMRNGHRRHSCFDLSPYHERP